MERINTIIENLTVTEIIVITIMLLLITIFLLNDTCKMIKRIEIEKSINEKESKDEDLEKTR